jgi:protein-tyrosine kinase
MTANIAIALSEAGISTLVVDANLRKPGLDSLFRPEQPSVGLRQVLGPDALGLPDVIHPEVLPNLSLVYAGLPDGQGADQLIGSERFEEFVGECLRQHRCTLVDVSAANQASDARRVAAVVGYALVVTRRNLTFARDVSLFLNELSSDGAQVIGSVLNDA